jgi:hypothetical protein
MRRFDVSGLFFDQIFNARPRNEALFKGYTSDAPEDMHIVGVSAYDPARDVWTLTVESAVFDELAEGEIPPLFTPTFTAHYDGGKP